MLRSMATTAASGAPAVGSLERDRWLSQRLEPSEALRAWMSFSVTRWQAKAGTALASAAVWLVFCAVLVTWPAASGLVMGLTVTVLGVAVVTALTRLTGVSSGTAVGLAGVVALDVYCLPLVHDDGPPDAQDALAVSACLITAGLLGLLAARARHRATRSESEARALGFQQAALRRVATLIATESPPERVFGGVTKEVGELLCLDLAVLLRYESDSTVTMTGGWSRMGPPPPLGSRWAMTAQTLAWAVRETRRPCRIEDVAQHQGPLDIWMRQVGVRSCIGSPVVVHGRPWGVMVGASVAAEPLADGTELRLAEFTDLTATTVANAYAQHELVASRARIVTSSNAARQRIERDLHDGVQQRLVSLALDVRRAETLAERGQVDLREQLSELRLGLVGAVDDLREVARGIHPSILSEAGLRPALARLARRSPVPVELSVRGDDRAPEAVEVCVYYVVSEALTNALKHAQATVITIELELDDSAVHLVVCDDGVGGADVRAGSGLVGLSDRLEALGGAIEVWSPADEGTRLEVRVPGSSVAPSSDARHCGAGLLVTSARS
jgi:signal transduction histidine kinase